MSVVCLDLADGLWTIVIESIGTVRRLLNDGVGKKRLESLRHHDRTRAWSASSVRCRERLVQIDMQHVDAEIAGPRDSHHRIQIRAVHVNQRAVRVEKPGNLGDLGFKNAKRVRIRDHDRRNILVYDLSQLLEIDRSSFVRWNTFDDVSCDGRARRIRSVSGVGNEELLPGIAPRFVVSTNHQDAG